ncbi:MAG: response regulator [Chloroflexi bacterium]|nr:response regulator [Chloroflexota bacterium]
MAKILVIDDDSELLEMISLLLGQREGHELTLSADGAEGLAQALADPPDLAIIDVMMPDVTGYDVCRQLRANASTADMPIIILTARGQTVDRQAALDAGADDYMSKPVTMAELSERVNELLVKSTEIKKAPFAGTIVLLSLRGGVGVTTLAVNLAATMAQAGEGAACLADFCPSSGHAALQLGLRPDPNWSSLVQTSSRDTETIEAHLLRHGSGLHVLASPVFPTLRQGLPQRVAQRVLSTLRRRFSTTIVDVPSVLDEATIAALEVATVVGLVVTAESPSLQTAIGTLRTLEQWSAKFRIILNQVTPGPQTPAEAIRRALRRPLIGTIPFDPNQAQALGQGTPLVLRDPTSPLAQAVQGLTRQLGL